MKILLRGNFEDNDNENFNQNFLKISRNFFGTIFLRIWKNMRIFTKLPKFRTTETLFKFSSFEQYLFDGFEHVKLRGNISFHGYIFIRCQLRVAALQDIKSARLSGNNVL